MTQPAPESRRKRLSRSMKTLLVTGGAIVAIAAIALPMAALGQPAPAALPSGSGAAPTLSADAHYLDQVGEDAPTVVEFLDFECEACGMLYPYVEEVREYYDGKINYVVRYFPLQGHFNSMHSALAVEAAAQQGKYEEMFHLMFETQGEWGEGQTSEAPRFRGYAEQLGLDLAAYDAAVADPATLTRIEDDYNAGLALGVTSTPTFFLDGEMLTLTTPNDLPDAIDRALTK